MKILQLALSLGAGGAERIAVSLCNRFAANADDEIVLVTILDDSVPRNIHYLKDLSSNVRFVNLHCKTGLQIKAFWKVFRTIKRERPDLVHCHTLAMLLLFPSLLIPRVCYFHTIHTLAQKAMEKYSLPKRMIMNYLFRQNKVKPITISKTCHQSFYETYKNSNDICIPNGSERLAVTEEVESVKKEVESLKQSLNTHHSSLSTFIHIARHHPTKNHDKLFRTFLRLEKEGERCVLIVLGEYYDSWKEKLKDSKSIFLLGAKKNVGDYMSQADFFVLSSDYEGLPMTLLEAMSMGVVPVSTPAGGVVDVVEDGVTGYLTENFGDEEFYRKVKQAIHEKGRIPSERIKDHFEKHFSMEVCARNYYETYRSVVMKKNDL